MCSYGQKKNEIILFENQGVKLEANLKLEKIEEQSLAIFKIFIKMKNYLKVQYAQKMSILLKMIKNIMYNITILIAKKA